MSSSINIDFDPKTGRFIIHSPFWALDLMRRIPNRKFEKRLNNAWTAPALRANVNYLQSQMPSQAVYTDAARVKMQEVLEPTVEVAEVFPRRYKFKREPKSHQMEALHASYGRKAFALFMDMRTGKTKVTIDRSMAMWQEGKLDRHLIMPLKTLRKNWEVAFGIDAHPEQYWLHHLDTTKPKEFRKFNETIDGRLKVLMVGIESLSAGNAHAMCLEFLAGPKSQTTIDESDSIMNYKSIRTQRTFELRDKSEYRLILTGTPISKGPMDFFSQFEFIDPNIFGIGDYYSFRNRYAIMGGFEDKEIVGYQNMDEFTEIVKPYVYQVRYADVFDSPEHEFEVREVELSPKQKEIYKRIKKDNTIRDDKGDIKLVVQNILEKMLRLQEICGGYWSERIPDGYVVDAKTQLQKPKYKYKSHRIEGPNPKVDEVVDVLTREYPDDQGIVWCVHVAEIHEIAERLAEHGTVAKFYGEVPEEERHQIDADFRAGKIKWIVANPTTGGRGYTFDAAYVMVNCTYTHHLIPRLQSLERATAGHKTRPVVIVDIMAAGTVDKAILEALNQKKDVGEYVREKIAGDKQSVDSLLGEW
jgi:hypothetical protein